MFQLHQNERPHRSLPLGQKHGPACRLDHQMERSRHVLDIDYKINEMADEKRCLQE